MDKSSFDLMIDNLLKKINANLQANANLTKSQEYANTPKLTSSPVLHIDFSNSSSIPILEHTDSSIPQCPNCNTFTLSHIPLEPYFLCSSCNSKFIDVEVPFPS